jgi:hypothetical protein
MPSVGTVYYYIIFTNIVNMLEINYALIVVYWQTHSDKYPPMHSYCLVSYIMAACFIGFSFTVMYEQKQRDASIWNSFDCNL